MSVVSTLLAGSPGIAGDVKPADHRPLRGPPRPANAGASGELADMEEIVTGALGRSAELVHLERLPARPAREATPAEPLPARVRDALGSDQLWSHQAEAIDAVRAGQSVAVATGTASGKSLCYQVPALDAAHRPGTPGTTLGLFPTKALAQDQLRALAELDPGLVAATYDGDTDTGERSWVRTHAGVIFTNPDMLHVGILPHHARWADFLKRLELVVVDELGVLRGIFGSHVAHVLRRLRRLCAHYGSDPTFVFTSATIGSPGALASGLCGRPVTEITDDGSPTGARLVALCLPPVIDDATGVRQSSNRTTAAVMGELMAAGQRTMGFCRSRVATESVAGGVRDRVGPALAGRVRSYRAGYLASERREIEAELFSGQLSGVVATNALELGIDVGGLDACVLNGFPGTIASFWQQIGRSGRGMRPSAAVLVAGEDALDRYLMRHPREVFTRPAEPAVINPANPQVRDAHLACAAYEGPLSPGDDRWWDSGDLADGVRDLVRADRLAIRRPRRPGGSPTRPGRRRAVVAGSDGVRAAWARQGFPAHGVGLRSGSSRDVAIRRADGALVGTVDEDRAASVVHPGAIYLHQGQAFRVSSLDLGAGEATVEPTDDAEATQARSQVDLAICSEDERRGEGAVTFHLGTVEVTSQVTGYQRKDLRGGEVLGVEDLDLPPQTLRTRGLWWVTEPELLAGADIDGPRVPGTLHALEHAAIGMLPLFCICDRWDVGGVSAAWLADAGGPTICIHDAYPGGAGVAELGFARAGELLEATRVALEACPCADGCPSCVQSPKCGNLNEPLDKAGAVTLAASSC